MCIRQSILTNHLVTNILGSFQLLTSDQLDLKDAKKRIRIDMEDADGARFDIKIEGNVTREKGPKKYLK